MSTRDRELLEQVGLSQRQVGRALEISGAAVSKGIAGDADYFTYERLKLLLDWLWEADPRRARLLEPLIKGRFPEASELIGKDTTPRVADDPSDTPFTELWVISRRPRELRDEEYFEEMVATHLNDNSKRISYFLPAGTGQALADKITPRLKSSPAELAIYEVEPLIAPHYVLLEASTDDVFGAVSTAAYDFARLPQRTAHDLASELERLRLHGKLNQIYPEI